MKYTKFTLHHTHVNKIKGKNQPLFIVVPGPKEQCAQCAKEKK